MTHDRSVPVGETDMFYLGAGDPPALTHVLVHGFPVPSAQFQQLIDHLADRLNLIIPGRRGFDTGHMETATPSADIAERIATLLSTHDNAGH